MNHADSVRRLQGAADLLHDLDGFFRSELLLFLNERAQIVTLDKLHGDELHSVGVAEIVDANDILVSDLMGEQEFLLESRQDRCIGGEFRPDQFQSHGTVKFPVVGFVDGAHPALTQQLQDLVAATQHIADLEHRSANLNVGGTSSGKRARRNRVGYRGVDIRKGCLRIAQRGLRIGRGVGKLDQSRKVTRVGTITLGGSAHPRLGGRVGRSCGSNRRFRFCINRLPWDAESRAPHKKNRKEVYTGTRPSVVKNGGFTS